MRNQKAAPSTPLSPCSNEYQPLLECIETDRKVLARFTSGSERFGQRRESHVLTKNRIAHEASSLHLALPILRPSKLFQLLYGNKQTVIDRRKGTLVVDSKNDKALLYALRHCALKFTSMSLAAHEPPYVYVCDCNARHLAGASQIGISASYC
jgi:hypothetical protein